MRRVTACIGKGSAMTRRVIPLARRPGDSAIIVFFLVNLLFITYVVDLEQLVIANPYHFSYPFWPPTPAVDAIHWWGRTFDPDLIAREAWWKMTIWIDNLLFGPFYVVAIYAYVKGKEWIRIPSIIYSSMLLTNVLIILGEEYAGTHATPHFPVVFLANLPWLVFPLYIIYRMWRDVHPFTEDGGESLTAVVGVPGGKTKGGR
jgi:EXPERA (EXPanded EBP superfamily)